MMKIKTSGEYPGLWQRGLIQNRIRERADHRCEECGIAFQPGTNLAVDAVRVNGLPLVGTVHHIDGNKCNCSLRNLVFLCQRCHFRLHLFGWTPGDELLRIWFNQPPHWIIARNLPYLPNPQLALPGVIVCQ